MSNVTSYQLRIKVYKHNYCSKNKMFYVTWEKTVLDDDGDRDARCEKDLFACLLEWHAATNLRWQKMWRQTNSVWRTRRGTKAVFLFSLLSVVYNSLLSFSHDLMLFKFLLVQCLVSSKLWIAYLTHCFPPFHMINHTFSLFVWLFVT